MNYHGPAISWVHVICMEKQDRPHCYSKLKLLAIGGVLLLLGCGQLERIPTQPPQTPTAWLASQPYTIIPLNQQSIYVMQPTSTLFVYVLGIVAVGIGLHGWRRWQGQYARRWWGVALVLWGIGALLAGTSYEGLSYHLKCGERAVCQWTTWWEVGYLLFSAGSINAMLVAQAYACGGNGRWRRGLMGYALLNMVVYATAVGIGVFVPVKFLISFEFLILAAAPTIVGFIILNGGRYWRGKHKMDAVLLATWLSLGGIIGLYFLYYLLEITPKLWAQGIWFSENDILHLSLIAWMGYIGRIVLPEVHDDT